MRTFRALILIATCIFCSSGVQGTDVQVYYESLCPYSMRFITKQLIPVWRELGQFFNVEFLPYGNAVTTASNDGQLSFDCQHGDDECYGNKVMACFVRHLEKQTQLVPIMYCMMSDSYPAFAGPKCASRMKLDYSVIEKCANSTEGSVLLAATGELTRKVKPTLKGVPSIGFNKEFNYDEQVTALTKFKKAICKYITKVAGNKCS